MDGYPHTPGTCTSPVAHRGTSCRRLKVRGGPDAKRIYTRCQWQEGQSKDQRAGVCESCIDDAYEPRCIPEAVLSVSFFYFYSCSCSLRPLEGKARKKKERNSKTERNSAWRMTLYFPPLFSASQRLTHAVIPITHSTCAWYVDRPAHAWPLDGPFVIFFCCVSSFLCFVVFVLLRCLLAG